MTDDNDSTTKTLDTWRDVELPAMLTAARDAFFEWKDDMHLSQEEASQRLDEWLPLDLNTGLERTTLSRMRRVERFRVIQLVMLVCWAKMCGHDITDLAQRMRDAGQDALVTFNYARTGEIPDVDLAERERERRKRQLSEAFGVLDDEQQIDFLEQVRSVARATSRARLASGQSVADRRARVIQSLDEARARLHAWVDAQPIPDALASATGPRQPRERKRRIMTRRRAAGDE